MKMQRFSSYDMIITVISLLSYLLDITSDVFVVVVFYLEGNYIWASISLAFIAISSASILLFSFRWHVTDRTLTCKTFLPHVLLLAPIHRYAEVLKLGYRSKKTGKKEDLDAALRANVDIALLRLIEAFTESAPQLVLQLYIMLKFSQYNWLLVVSTVLSLTSVSFSLTAYSDALRMAYKENYTRSWLGISILTIWQSWMLLSRVTAMVIFSLVFQAWIFLAMGLHWIFMTFWITLQNAEFGETVCEKRLFNSISGFIYIFCFLNLKEGHSRSRMAVFYIIILAENSLLMLLWFIYYPDDTPVWLKATSVSIVFGGFVLGGILMLCYYCCCHPTSKTAQDKKDFTAYWFKRANSLPERERDPIFEVNNSVGRVADWLNASVSLSNDDLDSKYVNMDDTSMNLSLPDILKNGTFLDRGNSSDCSKNLNYSRKVLEKKSSKRNWDWNGTVTSGKSSYISASSARPLINYSPSSVSYSPSSVSYISNSRDTFSFTNHVILDQERSASVSSITNSERAFALTGHNLSGKYKSMQVDDSFYAPPEYKASNLSPLDPKKLWDESESRLNNTANQIIQIVTTTNLKRRTSESRVTWMKLGNNINDSQENAAEKEKKQSYLMSRKYDNDRSSIDFNAQAQCSNCEQTSLDSNENTDLHSSGEVILERSNKENVIPSKESSLTTSYAHQTSRDYTSELESRSRLSNFFGDISSFHVTSPEVREYCSSSTSKSNLNVVDEGSDEYNNSLHTWSQRMLARINRELQKDNSLETTPSLTSSYAQEENSCSNSGISYRSMSSYNSTNHSNGSQEQTNSPIESSTSKVTELSSSYATGFSGSRSYSRHSTSDIGETSGSDISQKKIFNNRYSSSTTDKSTDDSGYSVAKSQSLKGDKVQNSLTFITKLGDSDFPDTLSRTNSHKGPERVKTQQTTKSLPGLSYLCSESDTSAWETDEDSIVGGFRLSNANTVLTEHTVRDDMTLLKEGETSKRSVRFEDQTPMKTSFTKITPISNLTPVKVGILHQSPFRPGSKVREDLTPIKLEEFRHSPMRPGHAMTKNSSLEVVNISDSPHKLGRSIDLFDRERYRNSATDSEMDLNIFSLTSNSFVRDYKDSPYKFKTKEKTSSNDNKENKYQHNKQKDKRLSSETSQESNTSQQTCRQGSRSLSNQDSNIQIYSIQSDSDFTNIKPRTIVDDFKKKHVLRNTQKKTLANRNDLSLYQSEAITNPCYAYSDTESETDISRKSHDEYRNVCHNSTNFGTPISTGEGKRQVLKRLDNTPGFSPILMPGDMAAIQFSDTSRNVLKPVVSTPKFTQGLYRTELKYSDDSPSTIEV